MRKPALSAFDRLRGRIRRREAAVAVVGMGYVGLPLAVALAGDGFRVTGFERAPDRLRALRQGRSYLLDVRSADLKTLLASKTLRITHEARQLRDSDVVIICVPTPLLTPQKPDLSFLKSAIESV